MNAQLTYARLQELLGAHEPPCVSVYLPTHRRHPESHLDAVALRNLLRGVQQALEKDYPDAAARGLLGPFERVADDATTWQHPQDGLALLGGPGRFEVFYVQRPVKPLTVVADSFHVQPLLRYLQAADRFQVLCLSRKDARVYEGNAYALDLAQPADFAAPLREAQTKERDRVDNPSAEQLAETERFFRAVDREVLLRFSKPSRLPLVLVALPEHKPLFRKVSHNPFLLPSGLACNPESLAADELRRQVWGVVEPHYLARLGRLKDDFHAALARGAATADIADAGRAAAAGRVGTLLVEDDRLLPGRLDPATGAVNNGRPGPGDMLDDLAEAVLRQGGQVVVVPAERMPAASGLAAIYRY